MLQLPATSRLSSAFQSLSVGNDSSGSVSSQRSGASRFLRGSSALQSVVGTGQQQSLLDRPLNRTKTSEVSLSAFTFLFCEIVQYTQKRVSGIPDLERKLAELGYRVGIRYAELVPYRLSNPSSSSVSFNIKRELKLLQVLTYVHSHIWKALFGKHADSLERSTDHEDEYMIADNDGTVLNRYISLPRDLQGQLNCAAFVAGIIEAVLAGAQFPALVTAHTSTSTPTDHPNRTVFLIKFDPVVMQREASTG